MSNHIAAALKNLLTASDDELKKLYVKTKKPAETEDATSEENELSDEDAELLQSLLK